jgi:hypothetical protein
METEVLSRRAIADTILEKDDAAVDIVASNLATLHQVLLDGSEFLKYGKRGQPHYKRVSCSVGGTLQWEPVPVSDSQRAENVPSSIKYKTLSFMV